MSVDDSVNRGFHFLNKARSGEMVENTWNSPGPISFNYEIIVFVKKN